MRDVEPRSVRGWRDAVAAAKLVGAHQRSPRAVLQDLEDGAARRIRREDAPARGDRDVVELHRLGNVDAAQHPQRIDVERDDGVSPLLAPGFGEGGSAHRVEDPPWRVHRDAEDGVEPEREVAHVHVVAHAHDLVLRDAAEEEASRRRVVGDAFRNEPRVVQLEGDRREIELRQSRLELGAQLLEARVVPESLEAEFARGNEPVAELEHLLQRGDRGVAIARLRLEAREIEIQRGVVGPFS